AGFERDRVVLGLTRNLVRPARVAALVKRCDLGRPLKGAALVQAGHILAIPLDFEFEAQVRVESAAVDGELRHSRFSFPWKVSSGGSLPGLLTDLDDDEFGRLQRRKTHENIDDPVVDVRLGGGFAVALDE